MNFHKHCSQVLGSIFQVHAALKAGEVDRIAEFFGKWWHEYENAKEETMPPIQFTMSETTFYDFIDGFGFKELNGKVRDEISRCRIAEQEKNKNPEDYNDLPF